jgi:hypothetical protein
MQAAIGSITVWTVPFTERILPRIVKVRRDWVKKYETRLPADEQAKLKATVNVISSSTTATAQAAD